jgi:hypothetical protein
MSSSSSSADETSLNKNTEPSEEEREDKEQVYDKIKSKIEILDILFHPTENNLINLGLINGKLKM